MSPQTETKAYVGFKAGVKDYRLTYYTPEYQVKPTDTLAAFRVTPQPGVPPEEAGAAVAAESSTGNVFGFKALRALRLEDLRVPTAYIKTFQGPPHGIQVERDKLNKYGRPLLGCTCEEMIKRAVFARELGVPIVMHDYITGGFTANTSLAHYCRDNGLLLHIHRAMHAVIDRQKNHGVLPVASGGIHVWHMPALTEIFGDDSVLQFGGGTLGHPWGNAPGAVANRVALEACVQARNEGRDLAREGNEIIREASKWSPELAAACEVWKEIKFEFEAMDTL
ncbi:hypothetical protein MLD38_040523 [Melastoma candidum]|nr:hypothetical protein MLD38_040523 [Melastoma candidum]